MNSHIVTAVLPAISDSEKAGAIFMFGALGLAMIVIVVLIFEGSLEDSRRRREHGDGHG